MQKRAAKLSTLALKLAKIGKFACNPILATTMPRISFFQSSHRLHADAEHLVADSTMDRSLNAAHFHGLASECGLKYLLLLCGALQRDPVTGDLTTRPRPHVDRMVNAAGLATSYQNLVSGHSHAHYLAQLAAISSLQTWKPEFRYYDGSHADYPKSQEASWRIASQQIQSALDAALLDGQPFY